MISRSIVRQRGLRTSTLCPIPHSRMDLQSGRTGLWLEQPKPFYFIRDYHYSSGPRHTVLQYTFRIGVPAQPWGGRHRRRSSQALGIFGSVCYCHVHADNRKKLDPSGEKELIVVTTRFRRHVEFTFLLAGGSL